MKRIFNLAFLISSGFFFLLSCTNAPKGKQLENKSVVSATTDQPEWEVRLNRKEVLSGKATILLPYEFELMDTEMVSSKYPIAGHRPKEVYTNKEGTINIALNYTQNKTEEKDLQEVKKTLESQLNQPTIEFIQSNTQEINGQKFIQLEFITPAADSKIYNLLQITSFEGRSVLFTFNCTVDNLKGWEAIGKQILQSIEMNVIAPTGSNSWL